MKLNQFACLGILSAMFLAACNLADDAIDGPVYTCDASTTVAEICIEEPADMAVQEASKSTCTSAKGSWSDSKRCPSSHTKQCKDGKKMNYYYNADDAKKECSQLVQAAAPPGDRWAMSFEPLPFPAY